MQSTEVAALRAEAKHLRTMLETKVAEQGHAREQARKGGSEVANLLASVAADVARTSSQALQGATSSRDLEDLHDTAGLQGDEMLELECLQEENASLRCGCSCSMRCHSCGRANLQPRGGQSHR
jgi:hypothetical protein